MRSGDAEFRPDRRRASAGCPDFGRARRALGALRDPDRARVLHEQRARGPASSRSTRARPGRPSASWTWPAGSCWWPTTRCWPTSSPTPRRWSSTASRRPHRYAIAPIDRCYGLVGLDQGELGGHLGRRRASSRRSTAFFDDLRATAGARVSDARRRVELRPRPRRAAYPVPEFAVLGAEADRSTRPRRRCASGCASSDAGGARGLHDRADRPDHVEPAKRTYDAATRERLVELFGAPERWAATTRSFLWRRVDVLVPTLHRRRPTFRPRRAVHLRPRDRGDEVLLLAARRRGPALVPLQRHDPLPRRGRPDADASRCRGAARRATRCRSTPGGR